MADVQRPPIPREEDARLIHQLFQARMCDLGYGKYIFDWDYMPHDAKKAWVECVSYIINDRLARIVSHLADDLRVPHYTEAPWKND